MTTMHCCHCGRRIKRAAAVIPPPTAPAALPHNGGPVGPVCAVNLGLGRRIPKMRKDGLPRAKPTRTLTPVYDRVPRHRAVVVDEKQRELEFA